MIPTLEFSIELCIYLANLKLFISHSLCFTDNNSVVDLSAFSLWLFLAVKVLCLILTNYRERIFCNITCKTAVCINKRYWLELVRLY